MTKSTSEQFRERFVTVLPGLVMPKKVTVPAAVNGYDVEVDVVPEGGRLVAAEVRIRQQPGGPPVTGEVLRAVPIATLTKLAAAHVLEVEEDVQSGGVVTGYNSRSLTPDVVANIRAAGPTDESLRWVAHLYRVALLMRERPTKAVETALGLPRATAGRWVALARDRGQLEPAEGAGKAGG
jgi:hypothetical protein